MTRWLGPVAENTILTLISYGHLEKANMMASKGAIRAHVAEELRKANAAMLYPGKYHYPFKEQSAQVGNLEAK